MFRMPFGGESEMVQLESCIPQSSFNNSAAAHMRAVGSPCANDFGCR